MATNHKIRRSSMHAVTLSPCTTHYCLSETLFPQYNDKRFHFHFYRLVLHITSHWNLPRTPTAMTFSLGNSYQ